jgi:hypothetical protein
LNFFINVVFQEEGTYWVQTLLDSEVVGEVALPVIVARQDSY